MSPATDGAEHDAVLVQRLRGLTTALVADILDSLGHRAQVMHHQVAALERGGTVAGRAFPMRAAVVYAKEDAHYDALFDSYEHMRAGQVIVIATNGDDNAGIWGELLSIGAMARGVTGAVIDGLTRDPDEIAALGFPCFARGASPMDSDGRLDIVAFDVAVRCGGVLVEPRDLVLGDRMGVVAIPAAIADEVIAKGEEKRRGEGQVRSDLEAGVTVREVFARYQIL